MKKEKLFKVADLVALANGFGRAGGKKEEQLSKHCQNIVKTLPKHCQNIAKHYKTLQNNAKTL